MKRLYETLHSLDGVRAPQNKRTVFVESADGPAVRAARAGEGPAAPAAAADDDSRGGGSSARGPRKGIAKREAKLERQRAAQHKELAERRQRHAKLATTLQRLSVERALQGKGRRKKLKSREGQPRQYKWRQERKR